MSKEQKHILVIRLSAMGDVAMTVPVLRALTDQYPELKITVLTRAFFKPFFRDLKHVTVFPAEVNCKHKGFFGLYKLSKELRALDIDAIADLHNVLRSKVLKTFLFNKSCVQIDKGRSEKRDLVSGKSFQPLKTTHQRYVEVFKALGFPIDLMQPTFPKKPVISASIRPFISDKKKNIGIAPFAAHEGKIYPLPLMEEVISELSKVYQIILFGGGDYEVNALKNLEQKFQNTVSIVGKLSLDAQLDVISNLDVMLSMDSGNAHIAAMLGVKVITIWGVTHPYAGFAPFNQPDDYALLSDRSQFPLIPTSVYGNKYPETYKSVSGNISSDKVVSKIKAILNGET